MHHKINGYDKRRFAKYVSLNVIAMIGLSCYILADTYFVSNRLGADGLAALNLAIPIFSFINGIGLMIGIGGATQYTIAKVSGDHKKANRVFTWSTLSGGIIGVLFVLIGVFFSDALTETLGADVVTHPMANTYLKTLLCFAPAFIINNILIAFVRNDGAPNLSMTAMLIASFSNVILDYVFMFPLSGGIFGAAFATGLAPVISILFISASYLIRKRNGFHFIKAAFQFKIITGIFSLGLSSLITELSSGIVMIVLNHIILKLEGNIGLAAYGIVANLSLVALSIFTGVAQGIQPIISEGYGKGDRGHVRTTFRYAIVIATGVAVILYLIVNFFAGDLVAVFDKSQNMNLRNLADKGLRFYFTGFFFVGVNIVSASLFSSVAKPVPSFVISILRGCVLIIPIAFLMSSMFQMSGVWFSMPVTEVLTAGVSLALLLVMFKKWKSEKAYKGEF